MEISDWISFGSVLIAFGSFIYSLSLGRKIKKLNEKQIEQLDHEKEERKKALPTAEILTKYKVMGNGTKVTVHRLFIKNQGLATAYNIRLDSEEILNDSCVQIPDPDTKFPLSGLDPNQNYEMPIFILSPHKSSYKIKFIWDDEYGKNRTKEQALYI